jgi:DNA-binding CsgD family transcriptional regulator
MAARLKKEGLTEREIAEGMGLKNTSEFRAMRSIELNREKQYRIARAMKLKEKGLSNMAIGREMNLPESTIRNLLAPGAKDKLDVLHNIANFLKDLVREKEYIDVGAGNERYMGITRNKFKTAVAMLKHEGYVVHYVRVPQLGTGFETTIPVLTAPGVSYNKVMANRDKIKIVRDGSDDGGVTFTRKIQYPTSISSKRVKVNWAEDGGGNADGVIYVRRGVDDISLGSSRYAQVRIAVDASHYMKGMAVYKDDMPPGVDIIYNSTKSKKDAKSKLDAMKPFSEDDPDNPFGSTIDRQHGVMNIVNEEGDWNNWASQLSSQMLSKQPHTLAKQQLDLTYESKRNEFETIMSLTNPTVRKKLLETFAEGADSSAVHLKAAGLPRTTSKVILPISSLKPNEVYAPGYNDGEKVVLIRHPHGGTFEIPELVVNNRNREARKMIPTDSKDAIGIHPSTAERLSGADFDGDSVLVIPNNKGSVKTSPPLEGLKNFDPKQQYKYYPGMQTMSKQRIQPEMGNITNLITDMQIKGASHEEIARAIRHSMVVIDAYKHKLDYKRSYEENNIKNLKERYQKSADGSGASTLISRAKSRADVPERKMLVRTDPETGKKIYLPTGNTYVDKKGRLVAKTTKSKKLAVTDDAHTLSSGTPVEKVYADHSNKLKALANEARREAANTPSLVSSPSAKRVYSKEVESLNAKLAIALENAPRERQAQVIANATSEAKRKANPDMEKETLKKIQYRDLQEARARVGAKKTLVDITDKEWEAIQAGAITNTKLLQILNNTDLDLVKERALPKIKVLMTSTKKRRAQSMLAAGHTLSEVASALGMSVSTLQRGLEGK